MPRRDARSRPPRVSRINTAPAGRSTVTVNNIENNFYGGSGYGSRRYGSSLSVGLFLGGGHWGLGFGYSRGHGYYGGSSLGFGFGVGPRYAGSVLHASSFAPCWGSYYWGRPVAYGVYNPFYRRSRFHFGFNYYYPYTTFCPYPVYRRVYYEPYYLSAYSYAIPSYRTYVYTSAAAPVSTDYVETVDPYLDQEIELSAAEIWEEPLYEEAAYVDDRVDPFLAPFVSDFDATMGYDEYLAWGEEALYNADYLSAAEAFRRAMKLRPDEDYAWFQMGVSLFGAEQYEIAAISIDGGLALNPSWVHRRFDLKDVFANSDEFTARVNQLERHLIQNDDAAAARFLLGYVYYYSGNLFGARNVFRLLSEQNDQNPSLDAFSREAERRLVQDKR